MKKLELNLFALNADENTAKIQGKINEVVSAIENIEKREPESCNLANISKRSELLKLECEDMTFDDYLAKFYKKAEIEITYKDKNRGETITEKALIRQYKRAFKLL